MNRYRYLVPSFLGSLLLLIYIPCHWIDRVVISWGEELFHPNFFVCLFCFFAGIHGAIRVYRFHPAFNKAYFTWLVLTPWDSSKPLPRGPVHLIWVDWVVLGIVSLLAYPKLGYDIWIIPSVFLGSYLLFLNISLAIQGQPDCLSISVFVLPLLWWPYGRWTVLPGLVVLYGVAYWGLQQQMKAYPWNTGWWKDNPIQKWKEQASSFQQVGWPFGPMMAADSQGISISESAGVAFVVTLWSHSVSALIDPPGFHVFLGAILIFWLCIMRIVLYEAGITYRSPISFWGRISAFRWIIPGYDQVFLASFLAAPVYVLCLVIGRILKGPFWFYSDLGLFLSLFILLACPPSLQQWRLTGSFRVYPRSVRQKTNSSTKTPDQIFRAIFSASPR